MKNRSPVAVLILPFITLGIYSLVWMVQTKNEMNAKGDTIPTAWLLIVPLANIWWLYRYSMGVEKVTNGAMSGIMAFILLWILGPIGSCIIQAEFNKLGEGATTATPAAPAAPTPPAAPAA